MRSAQLSAMHAARGTLTRVRRLVGLTTVEASALAAIEACIDELERESEPSAVERQLDAIEERIRESLSAPGD